MGREEMTWLSEPELNREGGNSPRPPCPKRNAHELVAAAGASSLLCSDMPVAQCEPHKRLFSAPTCRLGKLGQIHPVVWNTFFLGLVLTRCEEVVAYNVAPP